MELSSLPPPREAGGHSTRHPDAARCVRPRPRPRPVLPGPSHARAHPSGLPDSLRAGRTLAAGLRRVSGQREEGETRSSPPPLLFPPPHVRPDKPRQPQAEESDGRSPDAIPRVTAVNESPKFGRPPRAGTPPLIYFPSAPKPPRAARLPPLIPGRIQSPLVAQCQAGSGRGEAKTRGNRGPVTHSRLEVGEGRPPARWQPCTCADKGTVRRPRVLRGVVHWFFGTTFPISLRGRATEP